MRMFDTFLNSIPKNRYEMVNKLEIPDITLSPFTWVDDDSLTTRSDSILTCTDDVDWSTLSTDSSIPLSRAMTDSDIDYERYTRYKNRRYSDPWLEMRAATDNFPPGYLDSLYSFQTSDPVDLYSWERCRRYDDELRLKMERFFNECTVFTPDDPGLDELEDAIRDIDMKTLQAELDTIVIP